VPADSPAAHVLVVDDDQATLSLFRDLLLDSGYTVALLGELPADIDELVALGPDVVVLDLVFNGEERGSAFLTALRTRPASSSIPVLICTAATQHVEALAPELEPLTCGIILKPFDIDQLMAAIGRCVPSPVRRQATG
jgi:DNA-binding response OmpR family regulator